MAVALGHGVPMGSSLEYQRAWVSMRRTKTVRAWLEVFGLKDVTIHWTDTSWTRGRIDGWHSLKS